MVYPFQNPKNPLYYPHVHFHNKTQRTYRGVVPLFMGIGLGRAADLGANGACDEEHALPRFDF